MPSIYILQKTAHPLGNIGSYYRFYIHHFYKLQISASRILQQHLSLYQLSINFILLSWHDLEFLPYLFSSWNVCNSIGILYFGYVYTY
jgi:hypothetical protein